MQQSLFSGFAGPSVEETEPQTTNLSSIRLDDLTYTVLDLETTGLSAKKNAITEIVAIRYKAGQEIDKYSTLVKPTEPIPPEVEDLTGITNDMVKNAPAQVIALSELAGFLGASPIIVGHNVSFDINFLREKMSQTGLTVFQERVDLTRALCTRMLAIKAYPGLPSYEGIVVATSCGVFNPNPHRAESDVRMSAGILFAIFDKLKQTQPQIQTFADVLAYQGSLG